MAARNILVIIYRNIFGAVTMIFL